MVIKLKLNIMKKTILFASLFPQILFLSLFFHSTVLGVEISSPERISLLAKPAVVRLGMQVTGVVRYPGLRFAEDKDGNIVLVTTGEVAEDEITSGWTCSGFIINPSGYIVTNAHCVDTSVENVNNYVWAQFSATLFNTLQNRFPEASVTRLGQAAIDDFHSQILDFIAEKGVIDKPTYWFTVFDPNRAEGTIQEFIVKGLQAEIKKVGQPYPQPGKDVAIIKIEKDNLTTVKLGDSQDVKPGSRVFVMGFPAVADLNEAGYLEPSFTAGVVSAVKKSSEGDYNVIQIDAAISGGNSGGPVFNEKGEVIGIATFGATETQGFNWILPIELAKEFIQEINVVNTSGITNERYQKGIDYFLAKRYSKAKEEFQAVLALYPNRETAELITKSDVAIAKGEEKSDFFVLDFIKANPLLWAGAGIVVLLIIIGGGYLIIRYRRKRVEMISGLISPQPTVSPQPPTITAYVAESRSRGVSDETTRESLRKSGWPDSDIDAALRG